MGFPQVALVFYRHKETKETLCGVRAVLGRVRHGAGKHVPSVFLCFCDVPLCASPAVLGWGECLALEVPKSVWGTMFLFG